jgi:hypothetical protein
MARRSKSKTLTDLEGKLGVIRREVLKVLRALKREIAKREESLASLKAEYAQAEQLLRGQVKPGPQRIRRRARRSRRIKWEQVFSSLPARFSLKTLTKHPVAGRRPKSHLYAIVSRWKKEGILSRDTSGGYRKASAPSKPKRKARRVTPVPAKKSAAAQKAPRAQKPAAQAETPSG